MIHDHSGFDLDLSRFDVIDDDRVTIRRCRRCQPERTHLTGDEIGKLAVLGAMAATTIAFLVDAAGAWAALCSIVGL